MMTPWAEGKNVTVRYAGEIILHLDAETAAWLAAQLDNSKDQAAEELRTAIWQALG